MFFWMDVAAKVPTLGEYLKAASTAGGTQVVQAVIYDLPDRDCAAESSAGEFSIANGGAALYQQYIDDIATQVESTSKLSFYGEPELRDFISLPECPRCVRC